ncbi:MAG: hypothetical protein ABJ275_12040 [Maricaulaceae bacterium]
MASHGTKHHKLHGYVGWGLIIGLPFAVFSAVRAIGNQSQGFTDWLSTPVAGLGFLAFFTAAIWYCKLEFDEVVMDYFDGGLKSFALLANKAVGFLIWAATVYAVVKMAFLG